MRLNKYYNEIINLKDLYIKKCEENENLVKQWNSRYSDQHKCIQAAIDIALIERESLYKNIETLIKDQDRFSLENLLNYTPHI